MIPMKHLYKFITDANAVPFLLRGLIKFTTIAFDDILPKWNYRAIPQRRCVR
jgi:hypothetical protein